jgi:hypothetical protein
MLIYAKKKLTKIQLLERRVRKLKKYPKVRLSFYVSQPEADRLKADLKSNLTR